MNRSAFSRQLAIAHERTRTLPDWAKREAGLNMDKGELEQRMEAQQQHDEDALALGRLVRELLLSDLMRLSNERDTLLGERAAWRQDRERLDWLSRPENYDVEFILSQAGYRIQQPQRIAGTDRFEEVLLTSRDWPTLREALDEAIEKGGG